jgi:hypothetical protein
MEKDQNVLGRRRPPKNVKLIPTERVRSEHSPYQHKFAVESGEVQVHQAPSATGIAIGTTDTIPQSVLEHFDRHRTC